MKTTAQKLLEDRSFLEKRIKDQRAYLNDYWERIETGKVTRPDKIDVVLSAQNRLAWFEWVLSVRNGYEPYGRCLLDPD